MEQEQRTMEIPGAKEIDAEVEANRAKLFADTANAQAKTETPLRGFNVPDGPLFSLFNTQSEER